MIKTIFMWVSVASSIFSALGIIIFGIYYCVKSHKMTKEQRAAKKAQRAEIKKLKDQMKKDFIKSIKEIRIKK